jgi:carbon storage regulator
MLFLTRRDGEAITIGDRITVTVIAITGNQIKLGIDAPRDVPVHRAEVAERIAQGSNHRHARD